MPSSCRILYRAIRTTALCTAAALMLAPIASLAFNPNEGAEPAKPSSSSLPSTDAITSPISRFSYPNLSPTRRIPNGNPAPAAVSAAPTGAFPQAIPASAPSPIKAATIAAPPGAFVQPIPPAVELAPVISAPQFPPVDAAIAAQAARELQASGVQMQPAAAPTAAPISTGFIAPAPLLAAPAMPTQRPIENPVVAAPVSVGAMPGKPVASAALSDASKDILSKFPSKLNSAAPAAKGKQQKLAINRMSPEIQSLVVPKEKSESYDAVGLSIQVQRPGLDTNFELNRAYTALTNGDSSLAATTYKNILSSEPSNQDALFGLAATYHRLGDLERARPYYAQLLKANPNHREGLNNFLALVSAEAPQEALAELERLEQRNPDFSPIPAQQAALLSKNGFPDQAREKMLRAIELAPDNLTYKFNLAVMLDRQGKYVDASALYRLLIDAAMKGQKIPSSLDTIQKRLNFIATATTAAASVGS